MSDCDLINGISSADDITASDIMNGAVLFVDFWQVMQQSMLQVISDPNWKNVSWIPTKLAQNSHFVTIPWEVAVADEGERIAAGLAAANGVTVVTLLGVGVAVLTSPLTLPPAVAATLTAAVTLAGGLAWSQFAQDDLKDFYKGQLSNPDVVVTDTQIKTLFSNGSHWQEIVIDQNGELSLESSTGIKITSVPNAAGHLQTTWSFGGIEIGLDEAGNSFVRDARGLPHFESVPKGNEFSEDSLQAISDFQNLIKAEMGGAIEDFDDGYTQLPTGAIVQNDDGVSSILDGNSSVAATLAGTTIRTDGLAVHQYPDGSFFVAVENGQGGYDYLTRSSDGTFTLHKEGQLPFSFTDTEQLTPSGRLHVLDFMARAGNKSADFLKDLLTSHPEALNSIGDCLEDVLRELADRTKPSQGPGSDKADDAAAGVVSASGRPSPLVLDLDGDGVELTNIVNNPNIHWDHDLDGFAENSGWVSAHDGLLALDINQDGIINNSSELFGDQTGHDNGFLALAEHDSNGDGFITAEDQVWNSLRVWVDANQNAFSESDELHGLDTLGITSINLSYTEVSLPLEGNMILQSGSFVMNGQSYDIVDAYFSVDEMHTVYNENYDTDVRVLFMATAKGYGNIADLHVAMSIDNANGGLLEMVQGLSSLNIYDAFATNDAFDLVKDIIYRWAGVDGVDPGSRGTYISDARIVEFMEAFTGAPFLQNGYRADPLRDASKDLEAAFDLMQVHYTTMLLAQTVAEDLFTGTVYYNISTDSLEGITGLKLDLLNDIEMFVTGLPSTVEREAFWKNVVRLVENAVGVANLESGSLSALDVAINSSDATLELLDILESLGGENFINTLNGTNGVDTLVGTSGQDYIRGQSGDDTLSGGDGNDDLYGGNGDDVLIGGKHYDYLNGGSGADTYVYNAGDGIDVIDDEGITSYADQIVLGAGFDLSDVTFTRVGQYDLEINLDNGVDTGKLIIANHFNIRGTIETLVFDDATSINLTTMDYTQYGSAGDDRLWGVEYGGTGNDTIYGGDGDDTINGHNGANVLFGDTGNDKLYGGSGNDTLYGGEGNDFLSGGGGQNVYHTGAGNDSVSSGSGNDTYYYTGGHDVYTEGSGGTDAIYAASGYTSAATVYYKINNDLKIIFDEDNTITIRSFFQNTNYRIETLHFDGGPSVTLASVSYTLQGDEGNNTLSGTSGSDTLYGEGGNDVLNGGNGNDTLYGGTGNDTLNGSNGDDYLDGGAGDDYVNGYYGNDTYYYVSGHDTFVDDGSDTDTIVMAPGWELSDITFKRYADAPNNLVLELGSANSITIVGQHQITAKVIEYLQFADNSVYDLRTLQFETHGTSGNDSISGISYGGSNNDIIFGYGGNDSINGGDGNDVIDGGEGNDTLNGSAGNDTIYGGLGNDSLDGGNGDDHLYGGEGDDYVAGNDGNDTYYYSGGHDIFAEDWSDTDTIIMPDEWSFEDVTFKRYAATPNNLTLEIDENNSITLWAHFQNAARAFEYIKFGETTYDLKTMVFETHGTSGNDSIWGISTNGSIDDIIYGYDGNDNIGGAYGNDTLYGGAGNDSLDGGYGDDYLDGGEGDDYVVGYDGNDTYYYSGGHDTYVEDWSDTDTIIMSTEWTFGDATFKRYASSPNNLTIEIDGSNSITLQGHFQNAARAFEYITFGATSYDLKTMKYQTHGSAGADNIAGIGYNGSFDDIIFGYEGNDTLSGGAGNDTLDGGTGNDSLIGGAGNDTLIGGEGNDFMNGGADNDTYVYHSGLDTIYDNSGGTDTLHIAGGRTISDISISQSGTNAIVMMDSGVNEILLQAQNHANTNYRIETIQFDDGFLTTLTDYQSWIWGTAGADTLTGTAAHDTIIGLANDDIINGGGGADNLHGGAGNDTIYGGDGSDLLHGGAGDDILYGDAGADTIFGGDGADTFRFMADTAYSGIDIIKDFTTAQNDVIDISDLLDGIYDPMTDVLADFVQFSQSGSDTTVSIDRDGAGNTYGWTQVALLQGVLHTDPEALVTSGNLLVA